MRPGLAAYLAMAAFIGIGAVTVLFSREPDGRRKVSANRKPPGGGGTAGARPLLALSAVVSPILDFV